MHGEDRPKVCRFQSETSPHRVLSRAHGPLAMQRSWPLAYDFSFKATKLKGVSSKLLRLSLPPTLALGFGPSWPLETLAVGQE